MKNRSFRKTAFAKLQIFVLIFVFVSCIKREQYPLEPYIEYKDFYLTIDTVQNKTTGHIVFSFTDGDGDIGLSPSDTLYPYQYGGDYYYNFFIKFYRKENNELIEFPVNPPFNGRIPMLNPDDYPQNLKGEITMEIDASGLYFAFGKNPFKFKIYILDRAHNKSNEILSPDIILP